MWEYFWKYETDLPAGIGVAQFSKAHLTWTIAALMIIILAASLYRRQTIVLRRRMELVIAALLASGYVFRWIWVILIGHYDASEMLPLHLCSLSAIMEFIAVISRKPFFKEFGYACGIPGAIVTFIMPGMGPYPLWHFYYIVFILDHLILILLPVIWIRGDGFRPDIRRLARCLILLLGMAGVDVIVNTWINSNFMFLHYAPEGNFLKPAADFFSNPGYQFVMGGLLLIVWVFLYTPWIIAKKNHSFGKKYPERTEDG